MPHRWNGSDRRNLKYARKTYPSDPLSTILTWTALGSNQGLRGDRPATYRLIYGTAQNIKFDRNYF